MLIPPAWTARSLLADQNEQASLFDIQRTVSACAGEPKDDKPPIMNSRMALLALLSLGSAALSGGPWLYHRYRPAARWAREMTYAGQQPVFALVCLVLGLVGLLAAFLDQ